MAKNAAKDRPLPKNKNYSGTQNEPKDPMGFRDFASMPKNAIMQEFPRTDDYRTGITNEFPYDTKVLSGIHENQR